MSGDCGTGELLPSSEEVVEVRRRDNSIPRLADGKRMLRVLVVDDNREAADSLSRLVSLWRNEVRTAYGGAAALEMAVVTLSAFRPFIVAMPSLQTLRPLVGWKQGVGEYIGHRPCLIG
jgi:hypothetical protein